MQARLAKIGSEAYGNNIGGSWETIAMLGVMNSEYICSLMAIDSGNITDVFNVFIKH